MMGRITDFNKKESDSMEAPAIGARVRYFGNSRDHAARPKHLPFEPVPATVTDVNGTRVDLEVDVELDVLDPGIDHFTPEMQTGIVVRKNVPHLSEAADDVHDTGERESYWDSE